MKMVNMALSAKEQEAYTKPMADDAPKYPWGLRLNIGDESMDNLKIDKLPAVGDKMTLTAVVEVVSVRDSETKSGRDRSLELQITDMSLNAPPKPAEKVLYGDNG